MEPPQQIDMARDLVYTMSAPSLLEPAVQKESAQVAEESESSRKREAYDSPSSSPNRLASAARVYEVQHLGRYRSHFAPRREVSVQHHTAPAQKAWLTNQFVPPFDEAWSPEAGCALSLLRSASRPSQRVDFELL